MAEINGDVKKCPRCYILENKLHECSEMLRIERIDRGERDGFGDYGEVVNRFASVYRDMEPGAGADVLEVLTGAKELQNFWARASYLAGECGIKFAQRPY